MLAKARTCSRCGTAFRLSRDFAPARSEPLDLDETEINTASPKSENHPVTRLGIVAQGVYDQPRFLVDADASRGNSGSPIFLCSTGKFAGIVFAQAADTISIIDDAKQKVARMPYGASLAACIPASAIREFLESR
jgi:hypothetical protein